MRLKDIFDQFDRYGGVNPIILDILDVLVDINDNEHHDRAKYFNENNKKYIKKLLDQL